ncbi:putative antitoxin in type II toxin-antitoxin system [Klebsiella pneumoniae subsp. pneumoniae Kp13]|nr:putative antitoxin in type II toxin-antitoxin system [Klebsiella pneumoniae subsp. pneumoniae Kp13]
MNGFPARRLQRQGCAALNHALPRGPVTARC